MKKIEMSEKNIIMVIKAVRALKIKCVVEKDFEKSSACVMLEETLVSGDETILTEEEAKLMSEALKMEIERTKMFIDAHEYEDENAEVIEKKAKEKIEEAERIMRAC